MTAALMGNDDLREDRQSTITRRGVLCALRHQGSFLARELAKENGIDARCAGLMHEVLRRWPAAMVTATRR